MRSGGRSIPFSLSGSHGCCIIRCVVRRRVAGISVGKPMVTICLFVHHAIPCRPDVFLCGIVVRVGCAANALAALSARALVRRSHLWGVLLRRRVRRNSRCRRNRGHLESIRRWCGRGLGVAEGGHHLSPLLRLERLHVCSEVWRICENGR